MSKEREFLKKLRYASLLENDLRKELDELLAQPEQEPVAWIIETEIEGKLSEWICTDKKHYMDASDGKDPIPLYTAPQKRKHLTGIEISQGFQTDDNATHPYSYWSGVDFAEKAHGITGVDDD